jgi:hypothetical protein
MHGQQLPRVKQGGLPRPWCAQRRRRQTMAVRRRRDGGGEPMTRAHARAAWASARAAARAASAMAEQRRRTTPAAGGMPTEQRRWPPAAWADKAIGEALALYRSAGTAAAVLRTSGTCRGEAAGAEEEPPASVCAANEPVRPVKRTQDGAAQEERGGAEAGRAKPGGRAGRDPVAVRSRGGSHGRSRRKCPRAGLQRHRQGPRRGGQRRGRSRRQGTGARPRTPSGEERWCRRRQQPWWPRRLRWTGASDMGRQ